MIIVYLNGLKQGSVLTSELSQRYEKHYQKQLLRRNHHRKQFLLNRERRKQLTFQISCISRHLLAYNYVFRCESETSTLLSILLFLQTKLLEVLGGELDSLINIFRLSTLSKGSGTLATSLSTENTSDLVGPSGSISTLLLGLGGDVAAVDDLALGLIGGDEVDGLVLLL